MTRISTMARLLAVTLGSALAAIVLGKLFGMGLFGLFTGTEGSLTQAEADLIGTALGAIVGLTIAVVLVFECLRQSNRRGQS